MPCRGFFSKRSPTSRVFTFSQDIISFHLKVATVESYPQGYPQFAGLVGAHPTFTLSRRFCVVRARLLLLKQDRISILEKKLQALDRDEEQVLFLGASREDTNSQRTDVLHQLDAALKEYGQ